MKAATKYIAGALLLATLISGAATGASKNEGEKGVAQAQDRVVSRLLMRKKVNHSQKLLEALAIGDFSRITTNAKELQRIGLKARWTQPQALEYEEYGNEFQQALERVVRSSEDQDIDGAAVNFVQAILTCVECHKVVRDGNKIASAGDLDAPGLLEREMSISTLRPEN